MKDGDRYIDPDGKAGVYNEEQNEAAKAELAIPKWKRSLLKLMRWLLARMEGSK